MTPQHAEDRKPPSREAVHLQLGSQGEEAACSLLLSAGFVLLDRNWRKGRLELDMVCQDGDTVVFVEVKTRSSANYGGPAAGLTPAKRRTLCRAAVAWLAAHDAWGRPCRFDVVCIVRQGNALYPEHYRHAFTCESPLDRRHTPWQPW